MWKKVWNEGFIHGRHILSKFLISLPFYFWPVHSVHPEFHMNLLQGEMELVTMGFLFCGFKLIECWSLKLRTRRRRWQNNMQNGSTQPKDGIKSDISNFIICVVMWKAVFFKLLMTCSFFPPHARAFISQLIRSQISWTNFCSRSFKVDEIIFSALNPL